MTLKRTKSILTLVMLIALLIVPMHLVLAQDSGTDEPEATEEPPMGENMADLEVDETLGTEDNPIILLFIPSEDAQEVGTSAEDLANLITDETDLVFETRVATDYAAAIEAMCGGEAQIGALNTFGYILAHQRGCADVGVVSVRFGSAFYSGQLIVPADSDVMGWGDLGGKTFCRPDPLSTSGWIIPSIAMQAAGVDLDTVEVVDAGGHDGVVTAVYSGECDAGATYVDARSTIQDENPDVMDKVIVLDETLPIPNDTLSYSPMLSEETQTALTDALLAIAGDEANLELLGAVYDWSGLEAADDSFFDDFREQLDAAGVDIESLN